MGGTLAWTITIGLRNFETSADFPVHGDSVCQQQPQPVSRSAKDSRQRVPSAERILAFLIDQGIFQKNPPPERGQEKNHCAPIADFCACSGSVGIIKRAFTPNIS